MLGIVDTDNCDVVEIDPGFSSFGCEGMEDATRSSPNVHHDERIIGVGCSECLELEIE